MAFPIIARILVLFVAVFLLATASFQPAASPHNQTTLVLPPHGRNNSRGGRLVVATPTHRPAYTSNGGGCTPTPVPTAIVTAATGSSTAAKREIPLQRQLWYAVRNADLPRVKELLAVGADPTCLHNGYSYLQIAAQNSLYHRVGDMMGMPNPLVPVVATLIQHGADPAQRNAEGLTPYEHYRQYVMLYDNPEVAQLLRHSA